MGEVYLAHDDRLDRKVALKILPEDLAIDDDRMRRFVQEAKAAAHGCGLEPLIYTRDEARLGQLPVYFRTLNARPAPEREQVVTLIDDYLNSFKATS